MAVVALTGVIAAVAVPMMSNTLGGFRLSGDARVVSNAIALAKLRAAATFSQARVFIDLDGKTLRVERWEKSGTPTWVIENGSTPLGSGDSFGFGVVSTPPPNTQPGIAQASQCRDNAGAAIGNTACVLFNSRGIPVDSTGAPTALDAVYLTDGSAVYAATVSATGMTRVWRTLPRATPNWTQQ